MGTIARGVAVICVIQFVIYQVSSQQQPVSQYVLSNYQPSNGPQYTPRPLPLSSLSNLPAVSSPPSKPSGILLKPPEITTGSFDTNVLNNLAIALQLLIVSNIMNTPEPAPKIPNLAKLEALISKYESSVPCSMPSIVEQALSKPGLFSYEAQKPLLFDSQSLAKPSLYSYEALSKPSLYSYEAQSKPSLYSYEAQSKPSLYSYEAQSKPSLYSYDAQSKPSLYSYEAQSKPSLYSYETQLPNANFLGSSGLADPVLASINKARSSPRSSVTLMSPYDALGTSSFDISSAFPTSYTKKDFQSPYASILAADGGTDMFSMSDFL